MTVGVPYVSRMTETPGSPSEKPLPFTAERISASLALCWILADSKTRNRVSSNRFRLRSKISSENRHGDSYHFSRTTSQMLPGC
jgi:hypothetical protein